MDETKNLNIQFEKAIRLLAVHLPVSEENSRNKFLCDKNFSRPDLDCPCAGMSPVFKSPAQVKKFTCSPAQKNRPSGRLLLCRRGDLNSQALRHTILSRAWLPISSLRLMRYILQFFIKKSNTKTALAL